MLPLNYVQSVLLFKRNFYRVIERRTRKADLLEKLIVFLTPRRLGAKPPEGAGLSRNSALPLTSFVFIITAVAAFVDTWRTTRQSANVKSASHAPARAQPSALASDGHGATFVPNTHAEVAPAHTADAVCTAE